MELYTLPVAPRQGRSDPCLWPQDERAVVHHGSLGEYGCRAGGLGKTPMWVMQVIQSLPVEPVDTTGM